MELDLQTSHGIGLELTGNGTHEWRFYRNLQA